jgi:hypothetical protein
LKFKKRKKIIKKLILKLLKKAMGTLKLLKKYLMKKFLIQKIVRNI